MAGKSKKKLLVTGAADFVGEQTARMAIEEYGYSVVAQDNPGTDFEVLEKAGAKTIAAELTDPEQCARLIHGVDIVCHTATLFDLSLSRRALMRANHTSTKVLCEAAAKAGVGHFIFCSTADVYGTHKNVPINEQARLTPENDYSFSKLRAEQSVFAIGAEYEMPVTILRPSVIYGPGGVYLPTILCVLPYLIQDLVGFTPRFVGGPMVNAAHVEDVAGAMLFVAGRPKSFGNVYNVSDNDWLSLGEFVEKMWEPTGAHWWLKIPVMKLPLKVASIFGNILLPDVAIDLVNFILQRRWDKVVKDRRVLPFLSPRFDRGFFTYAMGDHVYDNSKLKNLGYKLRFEKFDRGYEKTVRWYMQNRWMPDSIKEPRA